MLQVYSTDVDVAVNSAIPFNNSYVFKGCSAVLSSPATIQLNRSGVYRVDITGSSDAAATIQLTRDGVPVPPAVSTGTNQFISTLIQVPTNNTPACYSSPVTLSVLNTGAEATFSNINMVVTKIC